jgi:deoxyribose-phosphate aldolase
MTSESAERIEALLAKPYPTTGDAEEFCNRARLEGYRSVVVPSSLVEVAYDFVADEGLKVCCLVGYPFGSSAADAKRFETELAADAGAHEIELVPSTSKLVEANYQEVLREIRDVVEAADERPVRVSIELLLWSDEHLGEIVRMILDSGAQYISTSIAPPLKRAVNAEDVQKLRGLAGPSFGIKVGGLKEVTEELDPLIAAGADRFGLLV